MDPCLSGVPTSLEVVTDLARGVSCCAMLDRNDLRRGGSPAAGLLLLLARNGVAILASMLLPVASIVLTALSPGKPRKHGRSGKSRRCTLRQPQEKFKNLEKNQRQIRQDKVEAGIDLGCSLKSSYVVTNL